MFPDLESSRRRLRRLNQAQLLLFLCVALALVYWVVLRGGAILVREDNPRLTEAELAIRRGRILDADDLVLAETVPVEGGLLRRYPVTDIGPAVGYYSFRYGTAGVEEGFDAVLRGESAAFWENFWQYDLLHQEQVGRDLRLTLRTDWQQLANELLAGRPGAVVLLTLPDGAIRIMASQPDFDPNRLDEQFEQLVADELAPLLNRAAQGQYQPGLILQPFILAAALDQGLIVMNQTLTAAGQPVQVNGSQLGCAAEVGEAAAWTEVLQQSCPGGMLALEPLFTPAALQQSLADFGLLSSPPVPIAVAAPEGAAGPVPVEDLALALIGQENLTVSPLQVLLAWATLANQGQTVQPRLVTALQDRAGQWQPLTVQAASGLAAGQDSAELPPAAVAPSTARRLLQATARYQGIIEHSALALSGPEGSYNGWYLGLAPSAAPRYAVVVILEDVAHPSAAREVGRGILLEIINN